MLKISKSKDSRIVKAILHRLADVPGGVTVKTAELGGSALLEGTPLAYLADDGMYHVTKTALIVEDVAADATTISIAKGSHLKVGDKIGTEGANGQAITAIDKTDASKDVVTVGTTLGVAITAASKTVAYETAGANKIVKYVPTCIAGQNADVVASDNLFVDAQVIAVVRAVNAPAVNDTLKSTLKGINYIV
jgi:hypothetical protein